MTFGTAKGKYLLVKTITESYKGTFSSTAFTLHNFGPECDWETETSVQTLVEDCNNNVMRLCV